MRVSISVQGRFHAYNLAAGLERLGHLQTLYTSLPKRYVRKFGVGPGHVETVLHWEALKRVLGKARLLERIPHGIYALNEAYDWEVSKRLGPCDVMTCWSGMGYHTLKRAGELGALRVLERGSSHIAVQRRILREEYERWGRLDRFHFDDRVVEKELREYELADAIAIPSSFVRRSFIEMGVPEAKLIQASFGVNLAEFAPRPRTEPGFRAIFAGGLTLQKAIPDLIEAARLAGCELWLVGSLHGEVRPFVEGAKHVVHKGHVPQAELAGLYSQADVFVIASVQEGMAMVILQALACGLPVICSANSGGEDVVREGETGFVVPIRAPEAIAAKLAWLRDNPEARARMSAAARASVAGAGTWDDYARTVAGHYGRLLGARGARGARGV